MLSKKIKLTVLCNSSYSFGGRYDSSRSEKKVFVIVPRFAMNVNSALKLSIWTGMSVNLTGNPLVSSVISKTGCGFFSELCSIKKIREVVDGSCSSQIRKNRSLCPSWVGSEQLNSRYFFRLLFSGCMAGITGFGERPDSASTILNVDDSTLDKPHSRSISLTGIHWSGNHHKMVQGISLVTLVWTDGISTYPLDFCIYHKDRS